MLSAEARRLSPFFLPFPILSATFSSSFFRGQCS